MATEMGRMPFFYNQEGRLVQVDYALQAVSRGSTTLGLKTKDSGWAGPWRTTASESKSSSGQVSSR